MKEIIQKIKINRLKPEERWFIDILNNLTEYTSDKYSDFIFYKKDNELLFEYNSEDKYFYCNYIKIWLVFDSKYNLNNQEIRILIKGQVEEHLKLKVKTVYKQSIFKYYLVEEHLKFEVKTVLI